MRAMSSHSQGWRFGLFRLKLVLKSLSLLPLNFSQERAI